MTREEMTLAEAQEIVCGWMESKPERGDSEWWLEVGLLGGKVCPRQLDLNALREVEGRLMWQQWSTYEDQLFATCPKHTSWSKWRIHADARSKCLALAKVIEEGR